MPTIFGGVPKQGKWAGTALALHRSAIRLNPIGTRLRERAVLTFRCARVALLSRWAARIGAVLTLSLTTLIAARADTLIVGGCVWSRGGANCVMRSGPPGDPYVRTVPRADTEAERARATERDQKWLDRCRPVISQDAYGVPRYHYSAKGCEFGVVQ
jgi:hypothetical protein